MQPIRYTSVFDDNAKAYLEKKRYIINQGSARSSKTYSILQLLYIIAQKHKPRLISVVSQTLPHLRRGAIRDFLNYLRTTGQYEEKCWNRSNLTYSIGNCSIEFFSVDQPDKVYGAARDILFVNEVNSVGEETLRQLAIRTRETIFMDFNPTHEFYVHTDYMRRDNAMFIHSTFKRNPYLSEEIVRELVEAGKRDENFQKVFVEGKIGSIEGVVFSNWEFGMFDETLPLMCFGQDYGFRSSPTTLVKVAVDEKKKRLYIKECFVKKGLSTAQIAELNKAYAKDSKIIGDSSEGRLIEELKAMGLKMEEATPRGAGSVSAGLLAMNDYTLVIDEDAVALPRELRNYVWIDKGSKLVIDDFNHCIDAARYAFQYLTRNRNAGKYIVG